MAIGETAVMPDYESGEIQPAAARLEEISPEEYLEIMSRI